MCVKKSERVKEEKDVRIDHRNLLWYIYRLLAEDMSPFRTLDRTLDSKVSQDSTHNKL